jgi:hypothetical protein
MKRDIQMSFPRHLLFLPCYSRVGLTGSVPCPIPFDSAAPNGPAPYGTPDLGGYFCGFSAYWVITVGKVKD